MTITNDRIKMMLNFKVIFLILLPFVNRKVYQLLLSLILIEKTIKKQGIAVY